MTDRLIYEALGLIILGPDPERDHRAAAEAGAEVLEQHRPDPDRPRSRWEAEEERPRRR